MIPRTRWRSATPRFRKAVAQFPETCRLIDGLIILKVIERVIGFDYFTKSTTSCTALKSSKCNGVKDTAELVVLPRNRRASEMATSPGSAVIG